MFACFFEDILRTGQQSYMSGIGLLPLFKEKRKSNIILTPLNPQLGPPWLTLAWRAE